MTLKYTKSITVPKREAEMVDRWLEEAGQGRDTYTKTVVFDNGVEADIKCCGCDDESSFAEAVLFKDGHEIGCSDVEFDFFGEWTLEYDGVKYTVFVNKESEAA